MTDTAAQPARARPSGARQILYWARRGVLLYALFGALYLNWRFDVQTLPREGLSPLMEYRPGCHLLIDRRRLEGREGEALLFRDDLGRLLIGRVAEAPAAETRPGIYLLADNPELALPDSRSLGPIAPQRIVGRVVCALPGLE